MSERADLDNFGWKMFKYGIRWETVSHSFFPFSPEFVLSASLA